MAEPIDIGLPFRMRTRVSQVKHVLGRGPDSSGKELILGVGGGRLPNHCKYREYQAFILQSVSHCYSAGGSSDAAFRCQCWH